ncbi:MAG: tetratricopeptide repeat protein [Thermoanaerobaculia bacterium]
MALGLLAVGCASAPRPEAIAPDAPFGIRDPALSLPPGTLSPSDARRLASGMDELRAGELGKARKTFVSAVANSAAPAPFRLGLAYADLLTSRFNAARESLAALVQENPGWVPAAEALADLDAAEGREREALHAYRKLGSALPDDPRLANRVAAIRNSLLAKGSAEAEAALQSNDLAAARRAALALVELDPSASSGYRFLARSAEADGRAEDAWTAAAKAHALDPADDAWTDIAAGMAMKTARYAEAVALYGDLVKRQPESAALLEEARFQFQVQNLPEAARRAATSVRTTRAQMAVLAWWLVPEVRDARVPAPPEVAVDAIDRPEGQALVRAIALRFFTVSRETHRVGADQAVTRTEAAAIFRRVALLANGGAPLPDCLAEERPSAASLEKCGILPGATSRTLSGREAVSGLGAAAKAGRGGDSR